MQGNVDLTKVNSRGALISVPATDDDGTGKKNDRTTDQHAQKQRVIEIVAVAYRIVSRAKQTGT